MRYPSFDIAWNHFLKDPQLMHGAVLEWEKGDVQDAAILGLIARYHDLGGDAQRVMDEMGQAKARVLKNVQSKKSNRFTYLAAAVILSLVGVSVWQYVERQNSVTWSYQDEGIPQFMDEKVEVVDWPQINYYFQKKEFERCLIPLKSGLLAQPSNDTALYYCGYCFLQMEARDSALFYFSKVPALGSAYSQKAQYFIFHLNPLGPDWQKLSGLSNVQDPILRQAVQRDIED